jgi:hypothetical protein
MNNEIKMEVLETMAEGAGSSTERYELRMRLETIHYEEIRRSECKKRALLRLILFVLIGLFLSLNLKSLASLSLPAERSTGSHLAEKTWWQWTGIKPVSTPVENPSR